MTKAQRPRVDLDPNIFKVIVIESAQRGIKPKDLLAQWVKENASPEVLALVGTPPIKTKSKTPKPESTNVPMSQISEGDKDPFVQSPISPIVPQSSERLGADDKKVLQLLQEGVTVRTEIAKKLGISKSKAQEHVKLLKSLGLFYEKPNKRGTKGKA